MSVYNKGKFLGVAVESVLSQSMSDFEFIIRDNCSTDDSVAIVQSFNDPRIRFCRNNRNLGPVVSMNLCIDDACGEYVVFAHGDDIWEQNFLASSLLEMEKFPQVSVVHSLMRTIDEHGAWSMPYTPTINVTPQLFSPDEVLQRLFKGCYVSMPTAVVRRNVMSYLDSRYVYTCDWDLWLRIAGGGSSFLFINRQLIRYRVTSGSETSVGSRSGEMILESYLNLRNFFLRNPLYLPYKRDALWRLSRSIMRRSRDLADKETILLYHQIALICAPINLLNPVFHLFFFTGRLLGVKGLRGLMSISRFFCAKQRGK